MNKATAYEKGLIFTGIYERSKEEVKARIEKEKLKKPKAKMYLVTVPDSPLSRGPIGKGYSVYADDVYFAYQTIDVLVPTIDSYVSKVENLKKKFENDLKLLEDRHQANIKLLEECKNKIEGK